MLSPDEELLLEQLGGARIVAERGGRIAYVSEEAGELLGYDPYDLVGMPIATLVPARLVRQHYAGFQRYLRTGQSRLLGQAIEVPAVCGDGRETTIKMSILMFKRPDGSDLIISTLLSASDAARLPTVQLERELVNRAYALV